MTKSVPTFLFQYGFEEEVNEEAVVSLRWGELIHTGDTRGLFK